MNQIEGTVERITFLNEENGYTVAKLIVGKAAQPVTVVGYIPGITEGELLRCKGEWKCNGKWGEQFVVESFESLMPTTEIGIIRYLSSGMVSGIGRTFAERIVKKFGRDTLNVLDNEPEKLREVEGIGPKRLKMLLESWKEQKGVREILIFLQGCGISQSLAIKIYQKYGIDAIAEVKRNPYRLALDITGIGFITADKIALNMGFDMNSAERAQAGLMYVLEKAATESGHCYLPPKDLLESARELLKIEDQIILDSLKRLILTEIVVPRVFDPLEDTRFDALPQVIDYFFEKEDFLASEENYGIYLRSLYFAEQGTAQKLRMIMASQGLLPRIKVEPALHWVQKQEHIELAPEQQEALKTALSSKVSVITGGPGTGKTTLVNCIVSILKAKNVAVKLAAPTGRAAKRLSEMTGEPASTIHRMLEYSPNTGGFERNEEHPLECDALILDEVSMIDIWLMQRLLDACPLTASLILVGDMDQLPSVGPGNVLCDIINSNVIPVVRLKYVFRQEEKSLIIVNAHRINQGLFPKIDRPMGDTLTDFYFIECASGGKILSTIKELVAERIPARFGLHPVHDIQVLSAIHKGEVGVERLNTELQELLNPHGRKITFGRKNFRIGDKVMQIRNDYVKEVFNGDVGEVVQVDEEEGVLRVDYQNRIVEYKKGESDNIILAYAASIHKSQGCEYPAVVIPIVTRHYMLLQRNLLYTAITRGKKLVVLVGTKAAINIAVKNNRTDLRYTYLEELLRKTRAK